MAARSHALAAAGILVLLASNLTACDYIEKRQLKNMIEQKNRALLGGDAGSYLSFFSKDYHDPWLDFEDARKRTIKRLSQNPLPEVSFSEPEIIIKDRKALVAERVVFEDKVDGRPMRYDEVQHLRVWKRGKSWECVRGSEVLRLLSGRIEEDLEIEQTLLRREAALVKRDLETYMSLVSKNYDHKGESPGDIKNKVRRNFQVYDDLKFTSYDRRVWFFGDYATVEQRFTIEALRLGEPVSMSGRERFELENTGEGWKFLKGL